MKKLLLLALVVPFLAAGCKEKDDPESRVITFTLEVNIPEGTPSGDVVTICGPCFGESLVLTPKYARVRTVSIVSRDFVPGKTLEDGFWFESGLFGRETDGKGSEVTRTLNAENGQIYKYTVESWAESTQEDIAAAMIRGKWSLVGTVNEWRLSLGKPLEASGDQRVITDISCNGSDSFKLVLDDSWRINYGYGEPNTTVAVNESEITLTRDGGNIQPAPGVYTLSFNPGTCVLRLSKTGEYIPPPEPDSWAIVGEYNGWNPSASYSFTRQKDGLYTASYVHLTKATAADGENAGFVLAKNGGMEGYLGLPGGTAAIMLGSETGLQENGFNLLVPENGYYDFVFNPEKGCVTVTSGSEPVLSSWSIVGKFNDWDPTTGIPFYKIGNWYVAFDVYLTQVIGPVGMGFKYVKNKSWDNNRGVTGSVGGEGGHQLVGLNEEVPLTQGGGNIQLEEEGSYDIYMNADTDKTYILKAGDVFLR